MKPWVDVITRHVAHWTALCKAKNIKWLPKFAYHFSDVHNAARILTDGLLLSRERAVAEGRMVNENAAAEVISETRADHKRFARLYFRPRTPTQYANEGILPPERRYQHAHCPVPIFFCFDLAKLLEQDGVMFSNGSMGRPEVQFGDSLELFQKIPFEFVYHDRSVAKDDKSKIVFHRHAEVLVPDQLPLTHLAGVTCRTDAERRTLLHLLPDSIRTTWQPKIHKVGDSLYFRRGRPHLDSVYSVDNSIRVRFNELFGSLPVALRVTNLQTGGTLSWAGNHTSASDLVFEFTRETQGQFEVEVRLHECVAFRGIVGIQDNLPF